MTDESIVPEETDFENEFNKLAEQKSSGGEVEDNLDDLGEEPKPEELTLDNDGLPGDGESNPAPEPDIYAGMDDATKAHFEKIEEDNKRLNHQISSDNGRVRAYQRQTQELQGKIQELNENSEKASNDSIAKAMQIKTDKWDKFGEDYDDIAETFDERAKLSGEAIQQAVNETLAPIKEQFAQIQKNTVDAQDAESKAVVAQAFENWESFMDRDEGKIEFKNWVETQPPGIQDLAQSYEPDDAIAMISLYDSYRIANGDPSLRKTTPDTGVEDAVNQQKMEANKLKARRKQQLEDGTTVASRGAKVNPGNETIDDYDTAFEYFANKKERQRA